MLPHLTLAAALALWTSCSRADSTSLVSSSWRKPNITTSLSDRISIAEAALEKAIGGLNSQAQYDGLAWGVAGVLYSQMAEFDIMTNGTKYHDQLTQFFGNASQFPGRANFSDDLTYGHAGARAYSAYKDPKFLEYATQAWWYGRTYTLTAAQVAAGSSPVKSFEIQDVCQGISLNGGSFWKNDTTDSTLTILATGYWLATSALLAEATADAMFLQGAIDSMTFIHSHLVNVQNIVQDAISAAASDSCQIDNDIEPVSSGLMIEGLAILYSVSGNSTVQLLLDDIVSATISNTAWQGADGIVAFPDTDLEYPRGDLELIRGLTAAYARNATSPQLHYDLGHYLAVQFNAVVELATDGSSGVYGLEWVGPPSSAFSGVNQTTALSVLLGAIRVGDDTDPALSLAPNSDPVHKTLIAAIVGGVVGGLAASALAVGIWMVQQRRRRRLRERRLSQEPVLSFDPEPEAMVIEAFEYPTNEAPVSATSVEGQSYPLSPTTSKAVMHPPWLQNPASTSTSLQTLTRVQTTALQTQDGTTTQRSTLPTEELVRLLNERLQEQTWDEGETPPEYTHAATGHSTLP